MHVWCVYVYSMHMCGVYVEHACVVGVVCVCLVWVSSMHTTSKWLEMVTTPHQRLNNGKCQQESRSNAMDLSYKIQQEYSIYWEPHRVFSIKSILRAKTTASIKNVHFIVVAGVQL